MSDVINFFNTVKYLKFKQIYYRMFYLMRNKLIIKTYHFKVRDQLKPIIWEDILFNQRSFLDSNSFEFLNIKHRFNSQIDWNFEEFGKLWAFNINYFDFLNQENMTIERGVQLIKDYVVNDKKLIDGKESYTISLRGINWIKFLSKHEIEDQEINQTLFNHFQRLLRNLELHLLGNHYLENGFALLFGAYYFQDKKFYKKAKQILIEELNEQVLIDGGHFELSPMYHQMMLHRTLDCINLIKNNNWNQYDLLSFLESKSILMLSWLQAVTFKNGNIPMVNDSTFDIAPTSKELYQYAKSLGLVWNEGRLLDSGYRKIEKGIYELFMDVGEVGASYQPAHVHSDTFNFELYIKNEPFIVDRGISTYEKNNLRREERGTSSHNTVQIGSIEQTNVWGGFRVAERAKIIQRIEHENKITASHNGYKKIGIIHKRIFMYNNNQIIIEDNIFGETELKKKAIFHFHPTIENLSLESNILRFNKKEIKMEFLGEIDKIETKSYYYNIGFNKSQKAFKVIVYFDKTLKTDIVLNEKDGYE